MFVRLVYESFRRQQRRKILAGAAITLGVTVATAMIAVATDIGDKINRELRNIGANLVVTPQEDSLDVEIGGVDLKPPSDGAFLHTGISSRKTREVRKRSGGRSSCGKRAPTSTPLPRYASKLVV